MGNVPTPPPSDPIGLSRPRDFTVRYWDVLEARRVERRFVNQKLMGLTLKLRALGVSTDKLRVKSEPTGVTA